MKPSKRIWELRSSTVCKVVGMALVMKDLQKLARKFGMSGNDPLMDEEFVLHSTVVQMCSRDNPVARHTEKLIEKRFLIHGKDVPLDDPVRTIRVVCESPHDIKAPLWAILWGLSTRGRLADERIETALFGFIHMMEHRLLRDHWRTLFSEDEAVECPYMEKDREILSLKRDLLDMQWANKRLEKLSESLRDRIESSQFIEPSPPAFFDSDGSAFPPSCRCEHSRKIRNLKDLLDRAKCCNYELETENAQLRNEIEGLLEELRSKEEKPADVQPSAPQVTCPYAVQLAGKRVTLVGGIESLECHYRRIIESLGGRFLRHDGVCNGGEQALEDCILGSDLVVCPVEVNSHNAAKSVKKICKARGVRCCFPRSASITGLRQALQEHYSGRQVA
ncbi:MAG: DUF2325 domain-containing protein [Desulfomonilaceae bacterium]|nr:DUF2325 domain-containing protein [Desulfomonilaceae bacterium]